MTFGWDYPPGVTGNEPEIAGYPEGEAPHVCDDIECDHKDDAWPYYEAHNARYFDDCEECGLSQMEVFPDWDEEDDVPEPPDDWDTPPDAHLDDVGD